MSHIALAANPDHQRELCRRLQLGEPTGKVGAVAGGLHHRMWRLVAGDRRFAVKQLAPDIDPDGPAGAVHFDATEAIAARFARRGLPALHALERDGAYLQCIDDSAYLVYPWVEACACGKGDVTPRQLQQVAQLLAAMHGANLQPLAPVPEDQRDYSLDNAGWLLDVALQRNVRHARLLRELRPGMLAIAERQPGARGRHDQRPLLSHGDLDHKNVLWSDTGEPLIIDWESARLLNPGYETILEALDWGGITAQFEFDRFDRLLRDYRAAGGVIEAGCGEAALDCIQGDWLYWLLYSVGRAVDLDHEGQRQLGNEQVDLALAVLMRLRRLRPALLRRVE